MPRSILGLAALAAVMAVPSSLVAQGFMVNEHGSCVMARGGVGTPKPCGDGSAINYNPAGIAGSSGGMLSLGATGIYAYGAFQEDYTGAKTDLVNPLIPVPHAYFTYGVTPQLTAGFGFFVPYGLGTKWPTTFQGYDTNFEGRFNGYDNDLKSMYLQPTVAYKINDLVSVGAGFDFVLGSVKLNQMLDFSEQYAPAPAPPGTTMGQLGIPFHTQFATAQIKASNATGFGGNFGVLLTPGKGVSIGARYMTRVKIDYDGQATFEQVESGIILPPSNPFGAPGGTPLDLVIAQLGLFADGAPLGAQGGKASITMPDQFSLGVAVSPSDVFTVMAEWQWVHWALFDTLTLAFDNAGTKVINEAYENTNGFRFGFEWAAAQKVMVRGGYLYHEGAAPPQTVTPLLPEGSRNEFTGGLGYQFSSRFAVDVAYQYIRQDKRRGRVREPEPGTAPSVDLNSGLYTFNAHLFGATLRMLF
jgi:long-chain fatty acid transport protein